MFTQTKKETEKLKSKDVDLKKTKFMALDNEKSHKYPSLFRLKSRNVGGLTEKTLTGRIFIISPQLKQKGLNTEIYHIF